MNTTHLFILTGLLIGIGIGVAVRYRSQHSHGKRSMPLAPAPPTLPSPPVPLTSLSELSIQLAHWSDGRAKILGAAEWLHHHVGISLVVIYSYDQAANHLADPVLVGSDVADLPKELRLGALLYGQIASEALSNRPAARYIEDVQREIYLGPSAPGTQTAYFFPLMHDGALYGVVGAHADRRSALDDPARRLLDQMGRLLAAELARAARLASSEQAVARFGHFQRLAGRLVARLALTDVLSEIVIAAREMLDTSMAILLEADLSSGDLHPVAWDGISDETAVKIRSHLKGDLKGLVAWAKQPARTADLRTDGRYALAREAVAAGMLSELAVPVLYLDELYGVLAVETVSHRRFSDEEIGLLTALASHAAIALHNARLFGSAQHYAQQLERANAELEVSRQQAEHARFAAVEANNFKTQFISNMSHELRTPLNAVINFTRLVADGHAGEVNETQRTYLTYVHDSGQHLLGLINDILDLAKIEAGKMELSRELKTIEPMLKSVMSTAIGLTRDKGVRLRLEVEPDLPPLYIDARRIRQVLLNLLSNAAKFTEQGEIVLRGGLTPTGDGLYVSVEDTGIGIRPEDLPKVFAEFEQVDNRLQQGTGTGLGMPISRRFVQLHGGDMWLKSTYGHGTTVYFSLPLNSENSPSAQPQVKAIEAT